MNSIQKLAQELSYPDRAMDPEFVDSQDIWLQARETFSEMSALMTKAGKLLMKLPPDKLELFEKATTSIDLEKMEDDLASLPDVCDLLRRA